jgi:hypothetical protein
VTGKLFLSAFREICRRRTISGSEDAFLELNLWIRSYKNEKEKCPLSDDEDLHCILSRSANFEQFRERLLTPQFEGITHFMSENWTFSRVIFFLLGHHTGTLQMNFKVCSELSLQISLCIPRHL